MTIRAGRLADWNAGGPDSMAKRISAELDALVPPRADEDPIARRKLCVAIAQGVVRYLQAQQASITVVVPSVSTTTKRAVVIDADFT